MSADANAPDDGSPDDAAPRLVTVADVEAARERVASWVRDTPIRRSRRLSRENSADVLLKLETLQVTGSFKPRGAIHKLLSLDDAERRAGVVCASAGNHAQGVAYGAASLGIPATIVMPTTTPQVKVDRTRAFGELIDVVLDGRSYDEAHDRAAVIRDETGRVFVPAFDDPLIIAGQGTIGLELLEQAADLEAVVVPIGGGGLISGIATVLRARRPEVAIYGVQSEQAPGMKRSFDEGRWTSPPCGRSLADGIAVKRPGRLTFEHVRRLVDDIVLVGEEEIERAVVDMMEIGKLVVEGAAGAAAAAVRGPLAGRIHGKRTVVVLSGANVDLRVLNRLIERELARTSRLTRLKALISDEPGGLASFLQVLAEERGNVRQIRHDRVFAPGALQQVEVVVTIEVINPTHLDAILRALRAAGHRVEEVRSEATGV